MCEQAVLLRQTNRQPEAREREEGGFWSLNTLSRPTFTRRSSYITIVTSLPNGAINQTDLELDFSEAEIERLMNMAEPAPALEHENHIQWQWAGPRIPCSEGGATFESREDGLLKGNPFEEAFNPWKTTLEDFTRRYTAPQAFQTGQGACSSLEATESGSATLRLKSVSSRLDANASTLEHALTRLQETLSAERVLSSTMTSVFDDDRVAHDSREGSGKLSPTSTYVDSEDEIMEILGHRAEKLPSSEHVLAKLCSTAIETVALVREMSESVAKYVSLPCPLSQLFAEMYHLKD
ncbi:uncharacterized protein EI90DRAFT_3013560 [Cantharellus anzutake]|uniref:uncharacterized protein n=1 Tax=Cantharellus anzutake TaxID=1750568 RepID=UPI001905493E|nr:uncharacterized protein EI90DRAFT_3013560 [Cantharellus anzutake]KAF8338309.1 hypothetical protein EI90DRAFT_3013560 [Cantharellus anzutake]